MPLRIPPAAAAAAIAAAAGLAALSHCQAQTSQPTAPAQPEVQLLVSSSVKLEARDLLTAALLVSSGAGQEARDLTTIALRLLWRSHTKAHGQLFMIGAATREVNLKIRRTFTQGGAVMSDGRAQTKHQRTATASSGALIFGTG